MVASLRIQQLYMKTIYYKLIILIVASALLVPGPGVRAELPSEYQIKAAFLYKFARFVEWPEGTFADDGDPIRIGVLGEDPFGGLLDRVVRDRMVQGRRLEIKRLERIEDLQDCHVLFVGSSHKRRLSQILQHLDGSGVLTVGEMSLFARDGGMIRLYTKEERVQFEINVDAAERAGLQISSELLKLARIIQLKDGREKP